MGLAAFDLTILDYKDALGKFFYGQSFFSLSLNSKCYLPLLRQLIQWPLSQFSQN